MFQDNADADYLKELKASSGLLEKRPDKVMQVDIKEISRDLLIDKEIDVVISNGLSLELYRVLKALKIVTITIDRLSDYLEHADIVIDHKNRGGNRYFTGPEYSFIDNRDFNERFDEITNLIKRLEWDSQFWGFPVAYMACRYLTDSIVFRTSRFIKANDIRVVKYLCNCHDNRSVKKATEEGFLFADIRLTFEKGLDEKSSVDLAPGMKLGLAKDADISGLREIAKVLYKDSRYYFDENFDKQKVSEFYQGWVEKAVQGQYDDECLCLYDKKTPLGFCTLRYHPSKVADIGLIGFSNKSQGKGLGRKMLCFVFNRLIDKGIKKVCVVTQGRNYIAQRFYQRAGFITKTTELWYHKWI